MTKVLEVSVTARCNSLLHQPRNGCHSTGNSSIKWTFKDTYLDKGNCVVVVEADEVRDGRTCRVDPTYDGGIFPAGTTGNFCELRLESGDMDVWTVSVQTDKDVPEKEDVVFQAGSGKGAPRAE